jgi:hypothetical protein
MTDVPRIWVRKGWFFWIACWPDEPVGEIDFPTHWRSRTREGAIAKACRAVTPQDSRWEEVGCTQPGLGPSQ